MRKKERISLRRRLKNGYRERIIRRRRKKENVKEKKISIRRRCSLLSKI